MIVVTLLATIPDDGVIECGDPLDPNNPINPECFPEPPGWLMPLIFTFTGLLVAIVIVLIVLARMARKRSQEYMAQKKAVDWVDLNEFVHRPAARAPSAEAARERAEQQEKRSRRTRKSGESADGKP